MDETKEFILGYMKCPGEQGQLECHECGIKRPDYCGADAVVMMRATQPSTPWEADVLITCGECGNMESLQGYINHHIEWVIPREIN